MLIRTTYIFLFALLSGCASVPTSIEPIQYGSQQNTGTVWVGSGLMIRSINGKSAPVHAKGSNAQSYARSLTLGAGTYSLSVYKSGYKSTSGGDDVQWDLTVEAGHTYLATTEPSAGGHRLVTTDYGYASTCKGRYIKASALIYSHEVICTKAE